MRRAYVYRGPGASRRCVAALCQLLRRLAVSQALQVDTLSAEDLLAGRWRQQAALLCLPGGRDLPVLRRLGARGAALVRAWVAGGGRYFGSCAGAYFAARDISFRAARVPAVVGRRPLGFFAGTAVGPSQRPTDFAYAGAAGAAWLALRAAGLQGAAAPLARCTAYNQGGCVFLPPPHGPWPRAIRVLAYGEDAFGPAGTARPAGGWPVALLTRYGRGRALLWGAHPELNFVNGVDGVDGPAAADGRPAAEARRQAHRLLRQHLHALLRPTVSSPRQILLDPGRAYPLSRGHFGRLTQR